MCFFLSLQTTTSASAAGHYYSRPPTHNGEDDDDLDNVSNLSVSSQDEAKMSILSQKLFLKNGIMTHLLSKELREAESDNIF